VRPQGSPSWIVIWDTESSDHGVDGYFTKKPTQKQLEGFMKKRFPDETASGTIYYHLEELSEESA
jgi:hypothetical protein